MIKLNSGISREIPGHFILNENGLYAIAKVLERRSKDLPYSCSIIFHVKREDDRFYETMHAEEVLQDANTPGRRIEQLRIELRNADPNKISNPWERDWIASVQFNTKENKQKIDVASENKDWALLLSDEIEPQIAKTLVSTRIPTLLLLAFYIATAYGLNAGAKILAPHIRFDFLPIAFLIIWGAAISLSIMTIERKNERLKKLIGPESSFNWGEQADSFNNREKLRQNLLWVVIVGFAISSITSIYTNTLFPSAPETASTPLQAPPSAQAYHPPTEPRLSNSQNK